jgi:caffeoyl-CoA O-methyltransferase
MDITPPELDSYLLSVTPSRHAILQEMETIASQRKFPIIGPLVGRILYQYGKLLNAKRIFELGSGYGYSAFWWSLATDSDAKIYCTEGSGENVRAGQEFLKRGGFASKVEYFEGDAIESMRKTSGEFDIVFMDIDKHQYPDGFRYAYPRLRKGGLFITDNVLWSGKIVQGNSEPSTLGILEYNRLIYGTPGATSTILPVRDGVAVTLKEL